MSEGLIEVCPGLKSAQNRSRFPPPGPQHNCRYIQVKLQLAPVLAIKPPVMPGVKLGDLDDSGTGE